MNSFQRDNHRFYERCMQSKASGGNEKSNIKRQNDEIRQLTEKKREADGRVLENWPKDIKEKYRKVNYALQLAMNQQKRSENEEWERRCRKNLMERVTQGVIRQNGHFKSNQRVQREDVAGFRGRGGQKKKKDGLKL